MYAVYSVLSFPNMCNQHSLVVLLSSPMYRICILIAYRSVVFKHQQKR